MTDATASPVLSLPRRRMAGWVRLLVWHAERLQNPDPVPVLPLIPAHAGQGPAFRLGEASHSRVNGLLLNQVKFS